MLYAVSLFFYVLSSYQHDVVLIKGHPGCDPSRICEVNGLDDIVANATNLSYLISMLVNKCVEAAAVAGWNDHISYEYVLRSNGALAPYQRLTNHADYAFCIKQGQGCSRKRPHERPCPPRPCPQPEPWRHETKPCPPAPQPWRPEPRREEQRYCPPAPRPPVVCPPSPQPPVFRPNHNYRPWIHCERRERESSSSSSTSCTSSSSSSSYSSRSGVRPHSSKSERRDKFPKYVKTKRSAGRTRRPSNKCEDWVKCCVENIKVVKTFVFDEKDLYDCGRIKLTELTDKAASQVKFVELGPLSHNQKLRKGDYPVLLRFPCFLLNFRKYIQGKYRYLNVCLYIDCRGRLYVRIRDTLYSVIFLEGTTFDERCTFKHIKLCPIRGKELNCLIQEGLAGIEFKGSRCD
ncbi:hypothetical protein GVAV_003147 [Gurleya vavrai]